MTIFMQCNAPFMYLVDLLSEDLQKESIYPIRKFPSRDQIEATQAHTSHQR